LFHALAGLGDLRRTARRLHRCGTWTFAAGRPLPYRAAPHPARARASASHAAIPCPGLHHTKNRTGVLIFASVAERYAEIVADAGINEKVTPHVWDQAIAALIAGIKQGRAGDGFVAAIEQCGAVLAEHFPPGALDRDELPNKLVEI